MSVIDKIKSRISSQPASFYVDEWETTIYCRPLTCGEMSDLQRKHPKFPSEMTGDAMVDLLIRKARDKDDNKMFTLEDKPILLRESTTTVSSIVSRILSAQISVEEAEKN